MTDTDNESPPSRRRRVVVRRNSNGFSNSGLSDSTVAEGVGNINDTVMQQAESEAVSIEPRPGTTVDPLANQSLQDDFSPLQRLQTVATRSSDYAREYRLNLLHRLLMRKIPLDEIATTLGISVSQVLRDRKELQLRLREESRKLDIDLLVGHNKGFYEEVVSMAMRAASNANIPIPMRLAAMRTALASQNDLHRFFQAAGVFDVMRYRMASNDNASSDIEKLMRMTEDLILEAKKPPSRNVNVLGDFSGGDNETLEL